MEEKAIAVLPTGGSEATLAESSGTDSHLTEDLPPELFVQVQQAIAPALATPPLQKLIGLTQPTVLKGAIAAVLDDRKSHTVANPIGLLMATIRQQWQPQQHNCITPPKFNAWFNWARSRGLAIASQQLDGVLHIYAAEGRCYPYIELQLPIRCQLKVTHSGHKATVRRNRKGARSPSWKGR